MLAREREEGSGDLRPDRVTQAEIFFDLVFVFTLTQLTRVLEADLTLGGAGRVLLLFGVLWWLYDGYVWLTNHVPPRPAVRRLLIFAGMAGSLIAAVGVPEAFGDTALVFAVGLLVATAVHLLMFLRSGVRSAIYRLAPFSLGGVALIIGAAFVDPPLNYLLWVAAFVVQAVLPQVLPANSWAGGIRQVNIVAPHFVERHGLLLILALGESVVAIGMGVESRHLTSATVGMVVLALALPAALWWNYFTGIRTAEHTLAEADPVRRTRLAEKAYLYAHIPIVLGILSSAAAVHAMVRRPGEPVGWSAAITLGCGVGLFLLGLAGFRATLRIRPPSSCLVAAAVVLATMPVGRLVDATLELGLVIAAVTALAVFDNVRTGPIPPRER
ncbi:low temperature requirement protein A [Plantactinospora sp. B5E13]|uniref:low temperature requirement protein A n=1 Tax=unclassified Plantactinospora TaxID=2631981 RepID=UPI00325C72C1